jgi:8-oxo-dGTP diphosphatase
MNQTIQRPERNWPRAGVGVLLIDEFGRALLTLRKLPPEAGCWSILGGKVNFLEALEECAIREAREEAGVEIAIERLLCVTDHRLPAEGQHWVSPAFLGRIMSGEARNREPDKTHQVRWFPLNQLPPNLTMTARNALAAYLGREGANTWTGRRDPVAIRLEQPKA